MTQITLPDGTIKSFDTKAEARRFLSSYADRLDADSTLTKEGLLVGDVCIKLDEV